jgi:integrase
MARPKKTRGRRANGEGSLYQRKSDERWVYAITFKGESKPRYFTGVTADEAIQKKDEALATIYQHGFLPEKNRLTVEQWMDSWMEIYKASDLTDNGRESYENEIDLRIRNSNIAKILLSELSTQDVQKWINKLNKSGRKDGKGGLAPKTVVRCWGVLNQALEKAVEEKYIVANPATKKLVNLPKIPKPQIKHMKIDDAAAFLEDIKDDYMYPAIVTSLMVGLRRGELLGLKWKDIDFKKGTVLIRRELLRTKTGPKLVERVKTDTGYRELELSPELAALLKEHKRQQLIIKRELMKEIGREEKVVELKRKKDPQKEDLVFCWPDGTWYTPDHFYRHLQRLLKKHDYEKLSVHGLRHTYATSAISLGVDLAVLQKNLGHADGATTAIYLHSDREREKAAAAKLEQALLKNLSSTITDTITDKSKKTGYK